MTKRVIRVFPRKTSCTPDDDLVRVNCPPGLFDEADEVHISVTFTDDVKRAEQLAYQWEPVAPVKIGGPGVGERGGEFTPGMYLKKGYVITSRGCPNKCWFCDVWKREGQVIREYPIKKGSNLLDDNLLACSDKHIEAVFSMLHDQPYGVEITGGLEAARLEDWHVRELAKLKPRSLFFAYDTPDDLEPLISAGRRIIDLWPGAVHRLRCHVLCGWKGDTLEAADKRMRQTRGAGFIPSAMVYINKRGNKRSGWGNFQRRWQRPAIAKKMNTSRPMSAARLEGI